MSCTGCGADDAASNEGVDAHQGALVVEGAVAELPVAAAATGPEVPELGDCEGVVVAGCDRDNAGPSEGQNLEQQSEKSAYRSTNNQD